MGARDTVTSNRRPLVSFIVPTLNRKRLVLRAIHSCLNVDTTGLDVDIQVVMSDAGSTDGAWEAMQEAFAGDKRVILVRSTPGSGPMDNWLNAAQHVTGDYVTFVWSDDYIAPHFLTDLLPLLDRGAAVAIGRGAIRDVEDSSPLQRSAVRTSIPPFRFLRGYAARGTTVGTTRLVSPTCSLFTRAVFDRWIDVARSWSFATPLRQEVLWKRAIGPDLLLYLVAFTASDAPVCVSNSETAQFSEHPGSISSSSSRIPFEAGYWIAAIWLLSDVRAAHVLGGGKLARLAAGLYVYGLVLIVLASGGSNSIKALNGGNLGLELTTIRRLVAARNIRTRFWTAFLAELVLTPWRLLRHLVLRGVRRMGSGAAN